MCLATQNRLVIAGGKGKDINYFLLCTGLGIMFMFTVNC